MPPQAAAPRDDTWLLGALAALLERIAMGADRRVIVDECVDAVVEVLGADRGMVLVLDSEGHPFAVNARGHGRALTAREREEVSATVVRRALDDGTCVLWQHDGGWATESVTRFGILSALAAPLVVRPPTLDAAPVKLGALYVDFRDARRAVGPQEQRLLSLAASIVALLLEQTRALALVRERAREATARTAPIQGPTVHELLAGPTLASLTGDVAAVVQGESTVLILGETGTGKTILAQAIAEASGRFPIVRAMLGSSDDLNTTASELFGHERGAFSGAFARRIGLVELADGGTLILDELLNLSVPAQKLLLDFTQFGTFRPLGHARGDPKQARVRIIACTNGDVEQAMRDGRLRTDLYYRLAGTTLRLPALRERRGAIGSLARSYFARSFSAARYRLTPALETRLAAPDLDWPGNVRELENLLRRLVERARARGADLALGADLLAAGDLGPGVSIAVIAGAVPGAAAAPPQPPASAGDVTAVAGAWADLQRRRAELDLAERALVTRALDLEEGVVARAARALGTSRTGLLSRMQTLGVARNVPPPRQEESDGTESPP
jgi:two-component system nitrogen regulation response regulator GlnG